MNPRRIWADFLVFSRSYFRNGAALFFSLIFPIILIGMFGLIFSAPSNQAIAVYTENFDHGSNASVQFLAALNKTGAVNVHVVSTNENFSTWLGEQGDSVGLIIPAGFQASYLNRSPDPVTVLTNPLDPASGGFVLGAVGGVSNLFNLQASKGHPIIYTIEEPVGSRVYKYIDYLVPGLIGFAILTSPMFAMVDISSTYRKDHLFRQLSLTPLTKGEWLFAKILWFIALTFVSAALMILMGEIAFGAHLTLTLGLVPFLILGPLFFVSLGMLAGSVAKTPESAAVAANVVTFPMMFLSGTFFPVSGFPPFLQTFAHILPLYYVIDGMNQVMLFGNYSRALFDLVIILVGAIVVFIAAILAFKWRDE